jgi:response regulator RpfG family c-di-GMP phosphodiesterase
MARRFTCAEAVIGLSSRRCHASSPEPEMHRRAQSLFRTVSGLLRKENPNSSASLSLRKDGPATDNITVIGLAFTDEDRRLLAGMCSRRQWNVLFADTYEQARAALDHLKAPVILCDRDLPGSQWRDVVQVLASSPHRACVILISRVVDNYLWNEVVQRGGYDVLLKPLREEDVVRTVRLAWSYWNAARRASVIAASDRDTGRLRR